MKRLFLLFTLALSSAFATEFVPVEDLNDTDSLKAEILKIAENYKGQGDPDLTIQNILDPYVEKLIELEPQVPVEERINTLAGRWQQVWGPYEYRSNARGVDKSIDPDGIYQVVSEDGYYWNVGKTLSKRTGKLKKITLLRGIYNVGEGDNLHVSFTRLKSIKPHIIPKDLSLTDLPNLAEFGNLPGMRTTLPNFFVRWTFGGGTLVEVYTDEDIRLAYGTDDNNGLSRYLYVMKRVE